MKLHPSAEQKLPSERRFGTLFSFVFLCITSYGFVKDWSKPLLGLTFIICAIFMILALSKPQFLAPLNHAWFQIGLMLGKIVSPIVLGLIFFILISPIAWAVRFFGRDELRLMKRPVNSYWIDRNPKGPEADSFKNQF